MGDIMKKYILIIISFVFFIDQFVKILVINSFTYNHTITVIPHFFYLTYVKNTGGAWSLFSDISSLLLIIGILSICLLFYYIYKKEIYKFSEVIYLGLLFGGVLGNFFDRLIHGGVIDYIGLIFGNYYFPIFNFADMCIVCSGLLLVIDLFRSDINGNRSK